MADVVAATSAAKLTELQAADPLITGIQFLYGHYPDIRERLMTQSNVTPTVLRYPLIAMFEDYRVRVGQVGITGIADLKLIILYLAKKGVTREQRETQVFDPILWPIYYEFLKQLKDSGKFMIYDTTKIQHDKIARPHWGDPALYGNNGYLFDDVLDGIELNRLELTTYLSNCQ